MTRVAGMSKDDYPIRCYTRGIVGTTRAIGFRPAWITFTNSTFTFAIARAYNAQIPVTRFVIAFAILARYSRRLILQMFRNLNLANIEQHWAKWAYTATLATHTFALVVTYGFVWTHLFGTLITGTELKMKTKQPPWSSNHLIHVETLPFSELSSLLHSHLAP